MNYPEYEDVLLDMHDESGFDIYEPEVSSCEQCNMSCPYYFICMEGE